MRKTFSKCLIMNNINRVWVRSFKLNLVF